MYDLCFWLPRQKIHVEYTWIPLVEYTWILRLFPPIFHEISTSFPPIIHELVEIWWKIGGSWITGGKLVKVSWKIGGKSLKIHVNSTSFHPRVFLIGAWWKYPWVEKSDIRLISSQSSGLDQRLLWAIWFRPDDWDDINLI